MLPTSISLSLSLSLYGFGRAQIGVPKLQWGDAWWDRAYNSAASKIVVTTDDNDCVAVVQQHSEGFKQVRSRVSE
jgi:hypothetical protein